MIIYVIDDSETNLAVLTAVIRNVARSHDSVCFTDPVEGLGACARRMPDVLVVDYMMPGIDGLEVVTRFRALPESQAVPIIMITATLDRDVRGKALDLGVSDFLAKPIDPYETQARLKTVFALRQAYLEIRDHDRSLVEEVRRATETILERERGLRLGMVIADATNHAGSIEDVFRLALAEICAFADWQVGVAFSVEDGSLQPSTAWHIDLPGDTAALSHAIAVAPASDSLASRVVASRGIEWVQHPGVATGPHEIAAASCGLKASCAFPVPVGSEIAAVLQFFTMGDLRLDESRQCPLSQVGKQLGRVVERSRVERFLIHHATHDPLTGLPNRRFVTERLEQALEDYKRDPSAHFAMLFIDLDRFKIINDSLGHLAGDELLVQVARCMKASVHGRDIPPSRSPTPVEERIVVARLGGDEFTILLNGVGTPRDALDVAHRIQQGLEHPFFVAGQEVYTGASIGIAFASPTYETSAEMLRDADLAMYHAKSLGHGHSKIFDPSMRRAAVIRLSREADLRRALREQEFVLHYQPIVDLATHRIVGFEALVRWQAPGSDLIQPADFIPVAEETGIIVPLGAWVLREACRTLRAWDAEKADTLVTMSVNVSPREFSEPGFVDQVERILRETGVCRERMRLEITEGAAMNDAEETVQVLSRLRALGVQLSVDDFGMGYSSLSYLHRFPLNILKVDRSFVMKLGERSESRDVITSIVGLARNMGLKVVAEGAEHADQIAVLKLLGCDFVQGFVFYRPLDVESATNLLRRGDPSAAALHRGQYPADLLDHRR